MHEGCHDGSECVPSVAGGDQQRVDVGALGEELRRVVVDLEVGVAVMCIHDLLNRLGT